MSHHMFTEDGLEKKKCGKCLEWQLLACFNKESSRKDGLCNTCRYCQAKYRRGLREKRKARNSLFLAKTTCLAHCLFLQAHYGFDSVDEGLSFEALVKTISDASRETAA